MAGGALGGVENDFAYKMIVFALAITILFPVFLNVYVVSYDTEDSVYDEALEQYYLFTGSNAATNENVWVLTGIYTPYTGSSFAYTDDGWLYGTKVQSYIPSQYTSGAQSAEGYTVTLQDGVYRYASFVTSTTDDDGTVTGTYGGYSVGDLYTAVTMDVEQQSYIFFTTSGKTVDESGYYYYEYSGYRYAFQPIADYVGVDSSGNATEVTATTTSLSLIWYNYYGSSGISGQLVLSGSDSGVAYITADQIVSAFDSSISTAKFNMVFNGVNMNVYIRIDPYALANGSSVEECYNLGYWSIMVTSLTTDASSYTSTSNSFSVAAIFDTIIDLFTFNAEDLGIDGIMGTICSLVVVVPLYAALLSIGMSFYPVLILAGILAAIQSLLAFI